MNHKKTMAGLVSSIAMVALLAGTAHAQDVPQPAQPPPPAPPATTPEAPPSAPLKTVPLTTSAGETQQTLNDGNQIYGPAFFAQYNLSNAEDMLRRIPGVTAILDNIGTNNQARGLGAGGDQILINGKRMASKQTDATAVLRRIRATTVDRVELLRGTSADTGVLSEGLIVNIVLKAGASATGGGQGNFEFNQRFDNEGWRDVDGLVSWSDSFGKLSYTLGYEKNLFTPVGNTPSGGEGGDYTRKFHDEVYYYPNGVVQQIRPQAWERQHHKNIFTAQGVYNFDDGSTLNLNFLYQPHPINQTDKTTYTAFTTAGIQVPGQTFEIHQNYSMRQIFEVGSEYERKLGPGTLDIIAIHNRTPVKTKDYRNRTNLLTGVLTEVSKNNNKQNTGEDVIRAQYSWPVLKGMTLTLGGEGAKNTLNQRNQIYIDFNKDGKQDVGPETDAFVQEQRGEVFAIHNWTLTKKATLESSLSYEFSTITTHFPAIPKENYGFLKPRLDFRYNVTPSDRFRAKVERTISQLNFNNFVPIYNTVDSRLDPGNASIAPEKTWNYETSLEHRLPKDQGTMQARLFYKDITDHIDRGPFGPPVGGLPQSAPINIPKATDLGLELTSSNRLTMFGLPNAQVNLRYQYQDSRVIDPFNHKVRPIYNLWDNEYSFSFRHDLTKLKASYGFLYLATDGVNTTSDIRTLQILKRAPRLSVFAEKALPHDLTLRFEIYNLTGSQETSYRALYNVSQDNGAVNRTETYTETRDIRYVIRLRGKF